MASPATKVIKAQAEKKILETVEVLYLNKNYSDIEVICGDKVFPAHQFVVFHQSSYFAKACSGRFKDPPGQARLEDKDPFVIEKVLEFLYKGSYTLVPSAMAANPEAGMEHSLGSFQSWPTPPAGNTSPPSSNKRQKPTSPQKAGKASFSKTGPAIALNEAYFHARMYAEGDFFMIDELKAVAKDNYDRALKYFRPHCFAETVWEVYSQRANYEPLKSALVTAAMKNVLCLRDPTDPILDRTLLISSPGFTEDLCMAYILKHSKRAG